jgi:hypothetical protein
MCASPVMVTGLTDQGGLMRPNSAIHHSAHFLQLCFLFLPLQSPQTLTL